LYTRTEILVAGFGAPSDMAAAALKNSDSLSFNFIDPVPSGAAMGSNLGQIRERLNGRPLEPR
jgi:hypothetical protein